MDSGCSDDTSEAHFGHWPTWGPWAIGAFPLLLAGIRVLVMSDFNIATALGVLAATGTFGAVMGAILAALPTFLASLTVIVWVGLVYRWRSVEADAPDHIKGLLLAMGIVLSILMVGYAPTSLTLFVAVAVGASLWLIYAPRRNESDRPAVFQRVVVFMGGGAFVFSFVAGTLLSSQAFLPAESLIVGDDEFVGYVVGEVGAWGTVLMEDTRNLRRFRVADLVSREFCRVGPPREASLWQVGTDSPSSDYDPCNP